MLGRLLARVLRATGKSYEPDPELPDGLIAGTLFGRAIDLARGLVRLRRPVYLGRHVALRGKRGLRLGRQVTIGRGCRIDGHARGGVSLGARTRLGDHTIVSCTSHLSRFGSGLTIGRDCGVGEFSYFGAAGGVRLGNDVIMGQFVSFHSENHRFDDPGAAIRVQGVSSQGIELADDVWVGARVTFLDGSRVGTHSVVAAGAVVQGQFPSHCLLGGVPARVLKRLPGAPESDSGE